MSLSRISLRPVKGGGRRQRHSRSGWRAEAKPCEHWAS